MLSSSLKVGDIVSVKVWFGIIDNLSVVNEDGRLWLKSPHGDIKLLLSSLAFSSIEFTQYSKWKYQQGKGMNQFTDYEEVNEKPKTNLLKQFLSNDK